MGNKRSGRVLLGCPRLGGRCSSKQRHPASQSLGRPEGALVLRAAPFCRQAHTCGAKVWDVKAPELLPWPMCPRCCSADGRCRSTASVSCMALPWQPSLVPPREERAYAVPTKGGVRSVVAHNTLAGRRCVCGHWWLDVTLRVPSYQRPFTAPFGYDLARRAGSAGRGDSATTTGAPYLLSPRQPALRMLASHGACLLKRREWGRGGRTGGSACTVGRFDRRIIQRRRRTSSVGRALLVGGGIEDCLPVRWPLEHPREKQGGSSGSSV